MRTISRVVCQALTMFLVGFALFVGGILYAAAWIALWIAGMCVALCLVISAMAFVWYFLTGIHGDIWIGLRWLLTGSVIFAMMAVLIATLGELRPDHRAAHRDRRRLQRIPALRLSDQR